MGKKQRFLPISLWRALAGLKEAAHLIPNQDVLINSIPLREARDSSAIENIVTTNDTLFRFASTNPEKADDATKEALRYRTALMKGFKDVQRRPLGTSTIACSQLPRRGRGRLGCSTC
jgi:Fic family protein